MITSIDLIHELLTTIYKSIFSRNRKDILKYDVLLYLDDYYYFDILKSVSEDIKELDPESCIIENDKDFNNIFTQFCECRNYIIKDKVYSNDNEKRIDFLHEILADLLCLLYHNGKEKRDKKMKGSDKIRSITKRGHLEKGNMNWEKIKQELVQIENLTEEKGNVISSGFELTSTHELTGKRKENEYLDEKYLKHILHIQSKSMQNEDIIIKQKINKETEEILKKLIEKYNNEYELRYYYLFLNHYMTMQTMFMSPLINLHSDEMKSIVSKIIQIKNMIYQPITIYDVLSFQYDNIEFYKSSYMNLITPVKKIKIVGDTIERGGIPTEFSKRVIMKDVISANISLKEKYSKVKRQNEANFGGRYKARNYYDTSGR
ncbi:hypothetical protein, conserved [Plasmodium gonderi]|uniref:Uncharacterized protein n=1 Tax=Plasmodium gonderi TaxID=77519 RepID=A0A1Y1JN91_PLAGO|nr:hypothetical protein, conserved [Plasmodium gonderi]GAW83720.1 hypothetical protein, conserved [Plasmodium gonderi]